MCLKFHIQNKNLTSNGRIPNSALSAITSTDDLSQCAVFNVIDIYISTDAQDTIRVTTGVSPRVKNQSDLNLIKYIWLESRSVVC